LSRESRKMEHVSLALSQATPDYNSFDEIVLLHNPIPDIDYDETSLDSQVGELRLSSPLLINAMTGGAIDTKEINRSLAIAAREMNVVLAVGSQMAAIKNPELAGTYSVVREVNPNGIIFANLGSEATLEQAKRAVEMITADCLQIHLNVMQELIMPEGDRKFSGMLERIRLIVDHIGCPVIVKEVGFGMSREAIERLKEAGVRIIDVAGRGGTNFAAIENHRGGHPFPFLNDWGIPTAISLLEASKVEGIEIIGSGGIRNGLDAVKTLSLGAVMVGLAGVVIKRLNQQGVEGVIHLLEELHHQIRLIMTATGVRRITDLRNLPLIIKGETREWCRLRAISPEAFANRNPFLN
jgi:isopentenyl-diphosphate delta-isomerase